MTDEQSNFNHLVLLALADTLDALTFVKELVVSIGIQLPQELNPVLDLPILGPINLIEAASMSFDNAVEVIAQAHDAFCEGLDEEERFDPKNN